MATQGHPYDSPAGHAFPSPDNGQEYLWRATEPDDVADDGNEEPDDDGGLSIRTAMEVHDRYVVELKMKSGPDRARSIEASSGARVDYDLDAWLFFPRSFRLDKTTYPAPGFFRDFKALLRREPRSLWIRKPGSYEYTDELDEGPLQEIKDELQRLVESERPQRPEAAQQIFYFGSVLRKSIKQMRRILDGPSQPSAQEARLRLARLNNRMMQMQALLSDFRCFRQSLRHIPHIADPRFVDATLTVDESASYILEDGLARLDRRLKRLSREVADESFRRSAGRMRSAMREAARVELAYRRRQGFCIHGVSHTGEEYFLYRVGQLKKAMDQTLYFDIRRQKLPDHITHLIGAIGAAFAAAFAWIGQIQPGTGLASGFSALSLLSIAVFVYVLKDRIKDVTKDKLKKWISGRQPDRYSEFSPMLNNAEGRVVGELRERVSWTTGDKVAPVIAAVRDCGHVVDVRTKRIETVLHYEKQVHYDIEDYQPNDPINVRDLFRFSVRSFLDHMDDPTRRISFFDEVEERFSSADAPKVYHVNLVLQVCVKETNKAGDVVEHTSWERLRIILNRKGIVRLEPVLERGTHNWLTRPHLEGAVASA